MESKTILVSGATGNIGLETLRHLWALNHHHKVIAADYKPEKAQKVLAGIADLSIRKLDFALTECFDQALEGVDVLFLLRPPNLADVKRYFEPFVYAMKKNKVEKVVFLSVQGVESQSLIPHYKIEKLIRDQGLEFVFLRPSYFMQNLTTTLLPDILASNRIFVPAGKLKFNWVDATDIGRVAAKVLVDFDQYVGTTPEITGTDFCDLYTAASIISDVTGRKVKYVSPNLFHFFIHQRKKGIPVPMILVMIMLHFLPRLGKNKARLTHVVEDIAGVKPVTLQQFIERERSRFVP